MEENLKKVSWKDQILQEKDQESCPRHPNHILVLQNSWCSYYYFQKYSVDLHLLVEAVDDSEVEAVLSEMVLVRRIGENYLD